MKRALVTGGAGFIGSNLVHKLVKEGWQVDVIDDMSNGHIELLEGLNIRHLPGPNFLEPYKNQAADRSTNDTVRLFEAAAGNVKKVIFASSSSVYGGADTLPTKETESKNPKSPYAWQKSAIEDYAKLCANLYDLDVTCLRYFNVFGPGQYGDSPYSTSVSAWCHAIKNGKECRSDGDGEQTRDMCYIDNVVHANIKAANCLDLINGQTFNIACADRVSNNEILAWLKNRYGDKVKVRNAPERQGDVKHTQADITKAKSQFEYEVQVRFWEGLERTVKWWGLDE